MSAADFARGFRLGAMMMRERAAIEADEEVAFSEIAESCACSEPAGVPCTISLADYWRLRVGNARVLADRIYHLPILGE